MFVVLHPADVRGADPGEVNPLAILAGAIVVLICLVFSFRLGFALAAAGIVALHLHQQWRNSRKWKGAGSWPLTKSVIEMVDVREVRRRKRRHYIGELAYSYSVQGEYYSGFCRCVFSSEKEARDFVETLRGEEIPVHYKPEAPEISLMTGANLAETAP